MPKITAEHMEQIRSGALAGIPLKDIREQLSGFGYTNPAIDYHYYQANKRGGGQSVKTKKTTSKKSSLPVADNIKTAVDALEVEHKSLLTRAAEVRRIIDELLPDDKIELPKTIR